MLIIRNIFFRISLIIIIITLGIFVGEAQQNLELRYNEALTASKMSLIAYQKPLPEIEQELTYEGWIWEHDKDISGLKWTVFNRTLDNGKQEYFISFAGTELSDIRDIVTDVAQAIRIEPILTTQGRKAINVAKELISKADGSENISVMCTGHSLGGLFAQLVTVNTGIFSYPFNPAPLGLSSRWDFNMEPRENLAANNTIRIISKGDPVSATPGAQFGYLIEINVSNQSSRLNVLRNHSMTNLAEALKSNKDAFFTQYKDPKNINRHPLQKPATNMDDFRDVVGFMKDFETIGNELNWIASKTGGKVEAFKNAKDVLDGIIAFSHDMQNTKGPNDWIRGETMQKLTEIGFDIFIDKMKKDAAKSLGISKMPTFGLDEIIQAEREKIIKGKTDINTITRYLDATVGLTWGILGYTYTMTSTGNHQAAMTAASTMENTGKALASVGRYGIEKVIQKYGVDKNVLKAEVYDMFYTANIAKMKNGQSQRKLSEMFDPANLRQLGISNKEIADVDQIVINSNIHISQARSNRSLRNMNSDPTVLIMKIDNFREISQFENNSLIVASRSELERMKSIKSNYRFVMESSGNLQRDKINAKMYNFNTMIYINPVSSSNKLDQPALHENYHTEIPNIDYSKTKKNASNQNNPYVDMDYLLSKMKKRDSPFVKKRDEYPIIKDNTLIFPPKPPPVPIGGPPPPPPPPPVPIHPPTYRRLPAMVGTRQSNIGGVMLSNVATVYPNTSHNTGKGDFSFVFNGNEPILDLDDYKKFCTSLWSVYFDSTPPGISIDPISTDPTVADVQMVRYIGNVINNDLGRVMRDADYKMKKWAVGTEKPEIAGFKDVDQLMASSNINYFGASRRFWFVPEGMHFTSGDGYCIFNGGRMTLKTEYIFLDNKTTKAEPADIAFANFFTDNYTQIASKHPIYQELYDYAKHVSLAHYLKQNKIPLLWFLMANKKFVGHEDSPGTVPQLVKGSKYFKGIQIVGGVNPNVPKGNYVYDAKAIGAINNAVKKQWSKGISSTQSSISKTKQPINIEIQNKDLTLIDEYSLTSGNDLFGNKYQTDLSVWEGDEPGLELVRISNSDFNTPGEFGRAWNYLKPYRIDVLMNDSVISDGLIWKKFCTLSNLMTGRTDMLKFTPDRYNYLGYSPIDTSNSEFILLMPLTDGSFELADKLGNYYSFNADGNITAMILGNLRETHLSFDIKDCDPENNPEIPMSLELGENRIDFGKYRVVEEIKVLDNMSETTHVFTIDKTSEYIEYKPKGESIYNKIKLINDGTFILTDLSGGEYHFDKNGCISEIYSGKEYKVEYEYFENGIDEFAASPYSLTKAANETVKVELGNYELFLPKKMSLTDLNQGRTTVFDYVDSDTCMYLPNDNASSFASIDYLTNGYYLVKTVTGHKIYFDEGGIFYSIIPVENNFLKSVKQGDYIANFNYKIVGDCIPVVDNIKVYKDLEWKLIYELTYEYNENGYLIDSNTILAEK